MAGRSQTQYQRSVAGDKGPGRSVGTPGVARTQLAPGPRPGPGSLRETASLPRSGPRNGASHFEGSTAIDRSTASGLAQSSAVSGAPGQTAQQQAALYGEDTPPREAARMPVGLGEGEGGGTEIDQAEERILSEIETGVLDIFGDSYCNKHLMYGIVELVLVRLMPELAEKGIIDLWEERLD